MPTREPDPGHQIPLDYPRQYPIAGYAKLDPPWWLWGVKVKAQVGDQVWELEDSAYGSVLVGPYEQLRSYLRATQSHLSEEDREQAHHIVDWQHFRISGLIKKFTRENAPCVGIVRPLHQGGVHSRGLDELQIYPWLREWRTTPVSREELLLNGVSVLDDAGFVQIATIAANLFLFDMSIEEIMRLSCYVDNGVISVSRPIDRKYTRVHYPGGGEILLAEYLPQDVRHRGYRCRFGCSRREYPAGSRPLSTGTDPMLAESPELRKTWVDHLPEPGSGLDRTAGVIPIGFYFNLAERVTGAVPRKLRPTVFNAITTPTICDMTRKADHVQDIQYGDAIWVGKAFSELLMVYVEGRGSRGTRRLRVSRVRVDIRRSGVGVVSKEGRKALRDLGEMVETEETSQTVFDAVERLVDLSELGEVVEDSQLDAEMEFVETEMEFVETRP